MSNKINGLTRSGTGKDNSVHRRTAGRRRKMFMLSAVLTMLFLAAGVGCLQLKADAAGSKKHTKVITTASDEEFAEKSSELAKKSRGLTIQSSDQARSRAYSSGRLIVCVEDGHKIDFSQYNAETVIESNFGVSLVQFASGSEAKAAAKKIAALPGVSYVEPDDCTMNIGETKVNDISSEGETSEETDIPSQDTDGDTNIGNLGSMTIPNRIYSGNDDMVFENSLTAEDVTIMSDSMSWGPAYIQADKYAAFVKTNTSRSIKVAVVDSGVASHSKLRGRIVSGRDFVDNDANPSDKNGHGTHVAGIIADCTPGINVKILPVRVMNASGVGNPSIVGNGIRYAANSGAKVINLSLGAYRHYKFIEDCVAYAHSKGATVVVAAGNDGDNTVNVCPAHMAEPIVVGSIQSNGKRAFYSNFGSSLDISAPGEEIRSCWLDGKYATASGTSMAAPHISAAAAMYRLMNPSMTPAKTETMVRTYAKDLGAKGTDKYYGRGVPRMAGAITPSSVALSSTKASMRVRKSMTLKAVITPSYAGRRNLTWSTSNESIVTVSGGKLTALHEGQATITVKTVNGKKASCLVTVSQATGELLNIGTLMSRPFAAAVAKTFDVESIVKKSTSASGSGKEAPAGQSASAGSDAKDSASSAAAQTLSVPDTASAQKTRIYIYPSEKAGNTPVQDGSIVAGSQLALDTEIVPAQTEKTAFLWKSSDPDVASVDENGIVTAVSAGEAQITASISGAASADDADSPEGTYKVNVVMPSVLTRNASYSAGDAEEEKIETVLRLPLPLEGQSNGQEDGSTASADYVLALLSGEKDGGTLLGAVNLGGDDSGTVHVHDAGSGRERTDITEVKGLSDDFLADRNLGKQTDETGILYVRSISADGCKAEVSLAADLEVLRAAAEAGAARTEKLSDCVIAVYTGDAFEEREEAVREEDWGTVGRIDDQAVCTCTFNLSYDVPAQDAEQTEEVPAADPANDGTDDPGNTDQNPDSETAPADPDPADSEQDDDADAPAGTDDAAPADGTDAGSEEGSNTDKEENSGAVDTGGSEEDAAENAPADQTLPEESSSETENASTDGNEVVDSMMESE